MDSPRVAGAEVRKPASPQSPHYRHRDHVTQASAPQAEAFADPSFNESHGVFWESQPGPEARRDPRPQISSSLWLVAVSAPATLSPLRTALILRVRFKQGVFCMEMFTEEHKALVQSPEVRSIVTGNNAQHKCGRAPATSAGAPSPSPAPPLCRSVGAHAVLKCTKRSSFGDRTLERTLWQIALSPLSVFLKCTHLTSMQVPMAAPHPPAPEPEGAKRPPVASDAAPRRVASACRPAVLCRTRSCGASKAPDASDTFIDTFCRGPVRPLSTGFS